MIRDFCPEDVRLVEKKDDGRVVEGRVRKQGLEDIQALLHPVFSLVGGWMGGKEKNE